MANEARLEEAANGGLVPDGDGWFVLNARDARWWHHDTFGSSVVFEGDDGRFPQFGINIQVLQPGQPNCMYTARTRRRTSSSSPASACCSSTVRSGR